MHILHVIESLEFGGAEKVVVHLANRLVENNQISICLTKREGPLVAELNAKINVYFLNAGEGNNWRIPGEIKKIIKSQGVNVIHSHNWSVYLESSIAALLVPKVRLIHTIHGKYMSYGSELVPKLKIKIRHFLEFFLSKRSFRIVSVSDSIKKYIGKDIGIRGKKCKTIRNGIKPIEYKDKPKVLNSLTRFVTVGRLAKVKNQKLMILAFERALFENHDISLTLIGDGPERESLEKLVDQLKISKNVNFLGFRNDASQLLLDYDVFLLSSDYEGISIALLEAMSCGMPAISTDVGGISETIIDFKTGLLVPQGALPDYSSAMTKLINERGLIDSMGKAANQFFQNNFHEDLVLEQYQLIYSSK